MRRSFTLFLVALVPLAFFVWRFDFLCDDAFIAFRYGRNLAEGLGLRFNPGIEPPVEGYTQLGWVLWIAAIERLGLDVTLGSRVTTIACAAALLWLVVRLVHERLELGALPALAAGLFLALLPPFAVWATGGLGTMAFALAIFLVFERLLGEPGRPHVAGAAAACVAAVILRADGLYWIGILLALAAAWGLRAGRRETVRASLVCAAAVALASAIHFAWRWSYYGDWLPNTARAKVGLSAMTLHRGALYLAAYWVAFPATLIVFAAGAWRALARPRAPLGLAVLLAAATFLYGVLVGGDFMCMGRFYLPAAPFLAVACAYLVQELASARTPRFAAAALGLVLATTAPAGFGVFLAPRPVRELTHFRWSHRYVDEVEVWSGMKSRAKSWAILGRALAVHTKPGETLVHGAIGAVGYYSRLFLYDQFGLTSREVARHPPTYRERSTPGHDRYVPPTFFADRGPTYLDAYLIRAGGTPKRETWGGTPRVVPLSARDGLPEDLALVLVVSGR